MWGNRAGWIASAVLVLIFVALVYTIAGTNDPTDPTDDFMEKLHPLTLKVNPESLVSANDSGDAGPLYAQAVEEFKAHKDLYMGKTPPPAGSPLPAFDLLVQAAHKSQMSMFSSNPGQLIDYNNVHPQLEAMQQLGLACIRHGFRLGKVPKASSQPASADQVARGVQLVEAGFALGTKMYNERVTYQEFVAAVSVLSEGSVTLASILGASDARRAHSFSMLHDELLASQKDYSYIFSTLHSIDPKFNAQAAGNVFYLVNPKNRAKVDRMWTVEALRTLGRFRWSDVGIAANQRMANRRCKELANDPDPLVKQAAILGRDLTAEQYHDVKY